MKIKYILTVSMLLLFNAIINGQILLWIDNNIQINNIFMILSIVSGLMCFNVAYGLVCRKLIR